jgi:hypothetical protein
LNGGIFPLLFLLGASGNPKLFETFKEGEKTPYQISPPKSN